MTLNEFQNGALETAIYPENYKIIYPALGLAGEAGEAADKVKKIIRDDSGEISEEKRHSLAMEIGDVLWYCATLAHDLGYNLDTIGQLNYAKLKSRQERGKIKGSGDNR